VNKTCLISRKAATTTNGDKQREKTVGDFFQKIFQYPKRRKGRKMQMTRITKKTSENKKKQFVWHICIVFRTETKEYAVINFLD